MVASVRGLAGALAIMVFAAAAQAKPLLYRCDFASPPPHKGLTSPVFFQYDAATGEVFVIDASIKYFFKDPIPGKLRTDNDRRLTIEWVLRNIKGRLNSIPHTFPAMHYSLTMMKSSHRAVVYHWAEGADDQASMTGSCALR